MKSTVLLSTIVYMVFMVACEKTEKVEDYPIHKSKLVANCMFIPDTCFIFSLSKSLSPIDNAPFRIMNSPSSFIKIFENNILFDSFGFNTDAGRYEGNPNRKPSVGNTYRFECTYPGYPRISAEDYLPPKPDIQSHNIYTSILRVFNVDDSMIICSYNTNLNLNLNPNILSKYLIIKIVPEMNRNYYNLYIGNVKDLFSENEFLYSFSQEQIFISNEAGIKKIALQWEIPYGYLRKNGISHKYKLEVFSCSKANFEYRKRMALQSDNNDDPFAEPIPITNNINNGYGIFGGFNHMFYPFEL